MMHGYMPFNAKEEILVPFRTWRNTNTGRAAAALSELFVYNIPLRWSISHLYQAILDNEAHVKDIKFLTTLAGYVHWQLTGEKVLGIGDASGMLPIDPTTNNYSAEMVAKFNKLIASNQYSWKLEDILPKVLSAGESAGVLTPEGCKKLDASGHLKAGIPVCPPEGDAGTGMVATNAVKQRTGNVSAGTSSFSMIVLEKELSKPYEMIDMVTTPDGSLVAMVHCNNCTSDLNAWVNLFKEYQELLGIPVDMDEIYGKLYNIALTGDTDCGGLLSYNYISGEPVTGLAEEDLCSYVRPMTSSTLQTSCELICTPQSEFSRLATTSCSTKKRSKSTESQVTVDCSEPKESVKEYSQQPSTRPYLLWKQPVKAVHGVLPCSVLTW